MCVNCNWISLIVFTTWGHHWFLSGQPFFKRRVIFPALTPFTQSLGSLNLYDCSLLLTLTSRGCAYTVILPRTCWPMHLKKTKKQQKKPHFAHLLWWPVWTPINCKLISIPFCSIHQYEPHHCLFQNNLPSGRKWDVIILIPSHSTIELLSKHIIQIHYFAISLRIFPVVSEP